MAKRVLQVITSTDRRGAQIFATDLDVALTEKGWDVRTVALASGSDGGSLNIPVLGHQELAPATLLRLRSEARRSAVVVAHGSTTLTASALATAGTGIPFVYRSIGDPGFWAATPLRRARVQLLMRRAQAVAVVWRGAADLLRDRFGLHPEQVRAIPNGVPAARFPLVDMRRRGEARHRLGLETDRATVAFVGALSPEKRVGDAIAALRSLPDVALVIAGEGPERARLEALAAADAPGRVRFLGVTDEPATVLAATDVLVLPSRTEGMPAVLIEAGMSGIPVVASGVGGVGEVVVDGVTGLLVVPGDRPTLVSAIERTLADHDRLSLDGREHCLEHFEITVVASKWDELLGELVTAS
jgi:glycosyltransferase involved in cell wall biosynthesis